MNEYFQFPPTLSAKVCIWLHGLGASGSDMRMIAEAMNVDGSWIRHVFLDAPERPVTINQGAVMPAWYDIVGFQPGAREDEEGIEASCRQIRSAIEAVCRSGFKSNQIVLAGFSQGAAMALYTALTTQQPLGGVVSLSGYLPQASTLVPQQARALPIFMGYGRYDSIVMPAWTQATVLWLKEQHYTALTIEDYPIDHCVCPEEVMALSQWFTRLTGEKK